MSDPWKILMYMSADNNLFPNALVSLRQTIEASRLGDVEILVQFDGPSQEAAARFRVANGTKTIVWEADDDEAVDRGQRLEDFLDWAAREERSSGKKGPILLILWGHGAGLDHVYVYDTASGTPAEPSASPVRVAKVGVKDFLDAGNANLYVKNIQLARILKDFTEKIGRNIAVLGLDACLMGMSEIAHEVRESVSILVASDEDIPDASFPYKEMIGEIERDSFMEGRKLARIMVDQYVASYDPLKDSTRASLSSLNLSGCRGFAEEFECLVRVLLAELPKGTAKNRIIRAREFARTQSEPTYIDVSVFLMEILESFGKFPKISRHASRASDSLYILHHGCAPKYNLMDSRGLALYFPEDLDPKEVAAASPSVYPVQPASRGTMPAATGVKTPPQNLDKNVTLSGGTTLPIRSYQVIWSEYVKLEFNRATRWSTLVEAFLPEIPQ